MKKVFFILSLFIISSLNGFAQSGNSEPDPEDIIFTKVETEAVFTGGPAAWRKYLEKNLQGDIPVKNGAPAGIYHVIIRFIVDRKGKISDVTAETRSGFGMEQEAIRVIKAGPDWTPAMQNGQIVKAYRRQPFTFVISEK